MKHLNHNNHTMITATSGKSQDSGRRDIRVTGSVRWDGYGVCTLSQWREVAEHVLVYIMHVLVMV